MHLGRFHAVISDLANHFKKADLPKKLENCAGILDQQVSSPATSHLESFRAAVKDLLAASEITNSDLMQPYAQQVIADLNLGQVMPSAFRSAITSTIQEKSFDPAGLAGDLRTIAANAKKKVSQLSAIDQGFSELEVEYERVENEEAEVGLLLPREIVGDSLKDLTTEFNHLGRLARAINELVGSEHYDPKVATISSSWWQLFLQLDSSQIIVWVVAIERIISLFKSNLEIKTLQQQLQDKQMPENITQLIEQEIEKRVSGGLQALAAELRKEYGKIDDDARLNEIETQLRQGLRHLATRMNQGAQVEVNVAIPEEPKQQKTKVGEVALSDEALQQLAELRARIERLENLKVRASAASVETLHMDRSAPLLLSNETRPDQLDSDTSQGSPI